MKWLKDIHFKEISLYSILLITLGTFLFALGVNSFIVPTGLFPTGFTGISYELSYLFDSFFNVEVPYNVLYFILNIPIIIFGYLNLGNKFIFKTFLSIILFTFFAAFIPEITPFAIESSGDILISGLIGAILMGTGIGLMLKVGGSSGGSDIIAIYFSLFKGKSFGLYNLIINSVVISIGFFITGDIKIVAITLIHLYVLNNVVDFIHNSQEKRTLIIITNRCEEVRESIYANFYRGLTILESQGGYGKEKNNTLLISISYGELHQMMNAIKEADENAFINVFKTDLIIGNFENPYRKNL